MADGADIVCGGSFLEVWWRVVVSMEGMRGKGQGKQRREGMGWGEEEREGEWRQIFRMG